MMDRLWKVQLILIFLCLVVVGSLDEYKKLAGIIKFYGILNMLMNNIHHHDFTVMPNGHILAIACEAKPYDEA